MKDQNNTPALKVFTIEDQQFSSGKIRSMLNELPFIKHLSNSYIDGATLMLAHIGMPDVVIIESNIENDHVSDRVLNSIADVRKHLPAVKVIVYSNASELHFRLACMAEGANFFFGRSSDIGKVAVTLQSIQYFVIQDRTL